MYSGLHSTPPGLTPRSRRGRRPPAESFNNPPQANRSKGPDLSPRGCQQRALRDGSDPPWTGIRLHDR